MDATTAAPPFAPPAAPEWAMVFQMSAQVDQLFAALSEAQGMMFSPARNKHVTVVRRGGETYEHRYSTADQINDMIRLPLSLTGLSLVHVTVPTKSGLMLRTCLLHKSGQWMSSAMPLLVEERGPQAMGSAMTYTKRMAICSVLNIASADDDDGNRAAGNTYYDHPDPSMPGAMARVMRERLKQLVNIANVAKTPRDIEVVLQKWQADMPHWMAARDVPEREDEWETLLRLIPSSLRRVHGEEIAGAWRGLTLATTSADIAALDERWNTEGVAPRLAMQAASTAGYGLLLEHRRLSKARVARIEEDLAAPPVAQVLPTPEPPAPPPPLPLPGLPPILPPVPEVEEPEPEPRPVFNLLDEGGEAASDFIGIQMLFANTYVSQHHASDDRYRLWQLNQEALEWCQRDPEAAAFLREHAAPWPPAEPRLALPQPAAAPAPEAQPQLPLGVLVASAAPAPGLLPPIPLLTTDRGTPALGPYLLRVKRDLSAIVDGPGVKAWTAANQATIDTLPQGTRLQVLQLIVACEAKLGLSGDNPAEDAAA